MQHKLSLLLYFLDNCILRKGKEKYSKVIKGYVYSPLIDTLKEKFLIKW